MKSKIYAKGAGMLEMSVALLLSSMVILSVVGVYGFSLRQSIINQNTSQLIDAQQQSLDSILSNVRLAGLGQTQQPIGVLLSNDQVNHLSYNNQAIQNKWLSRTMTEHSSGVNLPSEQLTIIYTAPTDMWNCEGEMVLGPRLARLKNGQMHYVDGQTVIERYFIAKQRNSDGFELRCDASKFITQDIERDGTRNKKGVASVFINAIIDHEVNRKYGVRKKYQLEGFAGQGEVLLSKVDGFWVRLVVLMPNGVRLLNFEEYQKTAMGRPIQGVQIAVLHQALLPDSSRTNQNTFEIFDSKISTEYLKNQAPRQLQLLNIHLRNQL